MKVSLITTVLNEKNTIGEFLKSVLRQTRKPDEFIIVDGGSTDNTYEVLRKYAKKYNWIKVFQVKNASIGRGRNFAIKKAKNDVIVVCDAGTRYDKHWLENLTKDFNGEVSFGIDLPLATTKFEILLGKSLCHKLKEGSSRNMIFSKKIWKEVGGYPEDLEVAEDTIFDEKIRRRGYKFSVVKNAICYWKMRKNLEELKKQFVRYGFWDMKGLKKYKILLPKHQLFILFSPFTLFILIIIFPFTIISLPLKIEFVKRFAYIYGMYKALIGGKNVC